MFAVKYLFAGLFLLYGCCLFSQPSPHFLGTKTPYRPLQTKYTPAPPQFKPIFINYVGRHGARFMTKPGSDVLLVDVMQQAEKEKALTVAGQTMLLAALQFENIEKGNYENITLLGADEQKGIGERIYKNYAAVLRHSALDVLTTTKVRTQQSANALLAGIAAYEEKKVHRIIIPDTADAMLRFYDMSAAYKTYEKSPAISLHTDSLQNDIRNNQVADAVCNRIFKSAFVHQLLADSIISNDGAGKKIKVSPKIFTASLYDVYSIHFSVRKEMSNRYSGEADHFAKAFTETELQWLDLVNNADEFYAKGGAQDTLGIQVTIAAPLLVHFINTTDSVVNGLKQPGAVLRFTHAEAISPFATLLGLPQASTESHSVYAVQPHWLASQIIPLSANIQWILYTDGKQYLLKVLLNEQEARLPVSTTIFPYYNWQAVRGYYIQKLSRLGVAPQRDMVEYLQRH